MRTLIVVCHKLREQRLEFRVRRPCMLPQPRLERPHTPFGNAVRLGTAPTDSHMHEAVVMSKLRKGVRGEVRATIGNQKLEVWWEQGCCCRNDLFAADLGAVGKQRQPVAGTRAIVGDD